MQVAKITGIRLAKNHIQISRQPVNIPPGPDSSLFRVLGGEAVNMPFMALNRAGEHSFATGSVASNRFGKLRLSEKERFAVMPVCLVSIYPHRYHLEVLLHSLAVLTGKGGVPFKFMASSNALLTFVVESQFCDAFIRSLADGFNLPDDFSPVEIEDDEEVQAFIKKRFIQTRARYVEKKIKTYGIKCLEGYFLTVARSSAADISALTESGTIKDADRSNFDFACAAAIGTDQYMWSVLTPDKPDKSLISGHEHTVMKADMLYLFGPHFGDRHNIAARMMDCLESDNLQVLQAGCTGAGISLVLPEESGKRAEASLAKVFDSP